MKRPEQHVTADKGITQVRSAFEGFGWTVEPVTKDYGVDLNVEVFAGGETTGITFKVQVRSSESSSYSQEGTYVSEQISKPNAKYWATELRSPVVVVHADLTSGQSFWALPQLDKMILEFLEQNQAETISIHIPTAHRLSDTPQELLDSLADAETVLATRSISETTVPRFLESIEGRIGKEQVFRAFKNKSDALGIAQAEDLIKSGSLDEVIADMERASSDAKAAAENRFWAVLVLERAEVVRASRTGRTADQPLIQMSVWVRLKQVSRRGPRHLKFYALVTKLAAQLHLLTSREFMLYINDKIGRGPQEDRFWQSVLRIERARLIRAIVRKFDQCLRLVGYSVNSDSLGALPHAMLRMVMAITPFVHRLKEEDLKAAEAYIQSAFGIARLAADVALVTGDEETAGWATGHAAMVVPGGTPEIASWAEEVIKKIKDRAKQAFFTENLREALQLPARADKALTIAEEQEIYRRMAEAQGIDLADATDSIAKIVNIGIADFDPTRVLRNCQHFFVSIGSTGLPGEWLGLPTAGSKILHCTLKRHSIGGISLDRIHESFKSNFCDACKDCSPHPLGWSYTHEWQRGQNELHKNFLGSENE